MCCLSHVVFLSSQTLEVLYCLELFLDVVQFCFSVLSCWCFQVVFGCFTLSVYVFFKSLGCCFLAKSGCFLICWTFDQVLQIAWSCSGSFWGSFPTVV